MTPPRSNDGFLRWALKNNPKGFEIIAACTASLTEKLQPFGFARKMKSFDGSNLQINSLYYESRKDDLLCYVEIIFDKWSALRFQANFATREPTAPYRWVRAGSLSRDQQEDMSSRWWGATRLSLSKEKALLKEWAILEENVAQVVAFLYNGQISKFVVNLPLG